MVAPATTPGATSIIIYFHLSISYIFHRTIMSSIVATRQQSLLRVLHGPLTSMLRSTPSPMTRAYWRPKFESRPFFNSHPHCLDRFTAVDWIPVQTQIRQPTSSRVSMADPRSGCRKAAPLWVPSGDGRSKPGPTSFGHRTSMQ